MTRAIDMRPRRFGVLASVPLLLAAACTPSNDAGPPVAIDPVTLYGQMCARCHGDNGKGDAQLKLTMPIRDFTDPEFRARAKSDAVEAVIMAGRNMMPSFGAQLSAAKISALAGHVRRLSAK